MRRSNRRAWSFGRLASLVAVACLAAPAQAEVERINVEQLGRLPAFSHATVASGQLVFVAGTLGFAPGSTELVAGGVGPQTRQALDNIDRILAAARSTRFDVLTCTVYLTDMTKFSEMNDVWMKFFGERVPARATVGVAALARGGAVEIECIAQRTGPTVG
jgi:2-iminobutanoate/2-iminopropanoate deaminase